MNIHEYQGKKIFSRYGIPVSKGIPAFTVDEAEAAAKKIIEETGNEVVVVKAQIHAGGRGKGGGVKVVKGASAAREAAEKMLGMQLVTHQTGPQGQKVRRLYVEQGQDIARELYVGMVVDREVRRVALMASTEGGVEIEEVAANSPEKILTEHIDPLLGLAPFQARKIAFALDVGKNTPGAQARPCSSMNSVISVSGCSARPTQSRKCFSHSGAATAGSCQARCSRSREHSPANRLRAVSRISNCSSVREKSTVYPLSPAAGPAPAPQSRCVESPRCRRQSWPPGN